MLALHGKLGVSYNRFFQVDGNGMKGHCIGLRFNESLFFGFGLALL
jgi:hypothetical protein